MIQSGPLLNKNKIERDFSSRDSLGIEGVAASIQAEICTVVNTVTPRAFYWAFMVWIYYDFYIRSGIREKTYDNFIKHLRRQDFFFVAATLLSNNNADNLVGKRNVSRILDVEGPVQFNDNYYRVKIGGMQYYGAGCVSRDLIKSTDEDGNAYELPRLNAVSKQIGEGFEKVIKNTRYYKEYRLSDKPVPRDILIEYGNVINIELKGFDEVKAVLKHRLFDTDAQLRTCAKYVDYLYNNYAVHHLNDSICRKLLFDHTTEAEMVIDIPNDLKLIADEWEIVIGRMYFTTGLEMLWKPMLERINSPKTKTEWIEDILDFSSFSFNINDPLADAVTSCIYDFKTREAMISKSRSGKQSETSVEDGLKLLFSVYNWLAHRPDFGDAERYLFFGNDSNSISLKTFMNTIDDYMGRPLLDFIIFIMDKWIIDQHYNTAFEKLFYNVDGFFYEIIDGKYLKRHSFYIDFQGNRMIQLMNVMKDLDMLKQ